MITLITGAPGSGKTLYAISSILRDIVGTKVEGTTDDGSPISYDRTLWTNIPRLLLDHELVDKDYINDWHNRCKPGDVLCFDEIQGPWPLAPSGSKVPDCIQALETHRHKGVDFVLMTQHPMLIHKNVTQLVGRHLHVRRVSNFGAAIIYEWDHCSRTLQFGNTMSKKPWRYDKRVFKLYKSAEVHTKMKRATPAMVWFIALGLAGAVYFGKDAYDRIYARATGQQAAEEPVKHLSPPAAQQPSLPPPMQPVPGTGGSLGAQASGRMCINGRCVCFAGTQRLPYDNDFCASVALAQPEPAPSPVPPPPSAPTQQPPPRVVMASAR